MQRSPARRTTSSGLSGPAAALAAALFVLGALNQPAASESLISFERSTLDFSTVLKLPFIASHAHILDSRTVLLTDNSSSNASARLVIYDMADAKEIRSIAVAGSIDAFQFDERSGLAFVAGNMDRDSLISRVRIQDGSVESVLIKGNLAYPAISTDRSGRAYLSDIRYNQIRMFDGGEFLAFDSALTAFKSKGELPKEFFYYPGALYSGAGTVRDFKLSPDEKIVFVSDSKETRVSAMELDGKQSILRQVGYSDFKGGSSVPYALVVNDTDESETSPAGVASLLLADYGQERLSLFEFDPSYTTFDILADAPMKLPIIPGSDIALSAAKAPDGSPLLQSPVLIDADNGQSAIIVANRFSKMMILYGRNGAALEKIREIPIPEAPRALDVAEDGKLAVAVGRRGDTIAVLRDPPETSGEPTQPNTLIGSDDLRSLQILLNNMGFPIGAIDGVNGNKTGRALRQVLEQNKLELKIENFDDLTPDEVQEAVKSLEKLG